MVDVDSAHLHYIATYNKTSWCDPSCPPGCDRHGWLDLIAGGAAPAMAFTQVPVKIEVKPVMLDA